MKSDTCLELRDASEEEWQWLLGTLSKEQRAALLCHFPLYAHKGQIPPIDGWRTWLIKAGRGFGKTRAGAEWVLGLVRGIPPRDGGAEGVAEQQRDRPQGGGGGCLDSSALNVEPPPSSAAQMPPPRDGEDRPSNLHIALVAATIDEARRVMVEGPSGILSLAMEGEIESWAPSRRELRFRNGAVATLYSGAKAEGLRGPEHHFAWCDELAKWPQGEDAWMNLQLGLRAGERPRVLITTTPRPSDLLRRIIAMPDTVETGGPTQANPFLPADFIAAMEARFAGTRIGRQELDGEMLDDVEGSLWPKKLVERCRLPIPLPCREGLGVGSAALSDCPPPTPPASGRGDMLRTIIGVDPPASVNGTCGIVVCGRDGARHAHVLDDRSVTGASPEQWAAAVARAARDWEADVIVAERNQGGDMVKSVLKAARADLHVRLVHAAKGKVARAEPVATLFERGEAFFDGCFPELEAQLGGLQAGGGYVGPGASPDRADAMVWAMTALMLEPEAEPSVRML